MRLVVDSRMINESGIGRYIRNLISNLQIIDKENEYFILHLKSDYQKLNYKNNFHKILADFQWYGVEEQIKMPVLLSKLTPDLVHFPHFNAPIFYKGKFIVTIHDLIHQHFSMERATTHGPFLHKVKQTGYKIVLKKALKRSLKILAPSNFVKRQLVSELEIPEDKIIVTYEAVDEKILQKKAGQKIKYPYIFFVGNAHPHKNIEGLIKAFFLLKKKYQNLKLVLAGHDHYFWQRVKQEFQENGIIYAGQISDEELIAYYKNARAFIMPSFEEGFGIPILESMSCSCPVVSSKAGSLPEVGGDACLYFDPYNINDMADKISCCLDDEKLRKSLIEKGLKRYKQFSWKKLAQQTLEAYNQCG